MRKSLTDTPSFYKLIGERGGNGGLKSNGETLVHLSRERGKEKRRRVIYLIRFGLNKAFINDTRWREGGSEGEGVGQGVLPQYTYS